MTDDGGRIVLGPAARELRRALRPIEWVVLEDVALDARRDDAGALVAPTSARRVAEHLGLTPGAVARALGALRSAGLVTHARQAGSAGRFGLSAYVFGPVPGLDVLAAAPEGDRPYPAPPHVERPRAVDAHMVKRKRRAAKPRTLQDRHGDRCTTTSLERWRPSSTTWRPRNLLARPVGHRRGPNGGRPPSRPPPSSASSTSPSNPNSSRTPNDGHDPATQHQLEATMTTTSFTDHTADHDHRSTHASAPTIPIPTDTCHVFDEAAGPSPASPC